MCALLVAPAVALNVMLLADKLTGAVPVPLSPTVCGLVIALSVNVSAPVAAPSATGVKVTPTVQFPFAFTLVLQVLLAIANGPVATMLLKLRDVLSRLDKVTVRAVLVLLSAAA